MTEELLRILALPRYASNGPSSRVRMFNYLPYLKDTGIDVEMQPFFNSSYIEDLFAGKKKDVWEILKAYWRRILLILRADKGQVFWLQYELLPWVPFWVEKLFLSRCKKLIIDYDDAVFDRYQNHSFFLIRWVLGNKISRLMAMASMVVVGNQYLADFARSSGAEDVLIIPSVVDLKKFQPKNWHAADNHHPLQIGWIGSPSTVHYLLLIKDVILDSIANGCTWTVIGADIPEPLKVPGISSRKWMLENEGDLLQSLDVGVMPLKADAFEKGKCGYKLIQYMACALPVVASPVGVNELLIKHGENGFLANNQIEWAQALDALLDIQLRKRMGNAGRRLVEETYNYFIQSKVLIDLFEKTGGSVKQSQ